MNHAKCHRPNVAKTVEVTSERILEQSPETHMVITLALYDCATEPEGTHVCNGMGVRDGTPDRDIARYARSAAAALRILASRLEDKYGTSTHTPRSEHVYRSDLVAPTNDEEPS